MSARVLAAVLPTLAAGATALTLWLCNQGAADGGKKQQQRGVQILAHDASLATRGAADEVSLIS
jgi:hypothetical protein